MINNKKLVDGIYAVGVNHWDRKVFDALVPLPWGTSYNSYLLKGEQKTALIDTVDPEKSEELLLNLQKHSIEKLDFIISNHAEQDHSGSIPILLQKYPNATILTTPRGAEMLQDFSLVSQEQVKTVENEESLSLGGLTLKFFHLPWVHWPETMVTYLPEHEILFSCDLFGSHLASSSLFASDEKQSLYAALIYYAEIMMPFARHIRKHLNLIRDLKLKMIAPSHGPVWDNPDTILSGYDKWTGENYENRVILPFITMHGSTQEIVNKFTGFAEGEGLKIIPFDMSSADLGEFAATLVNTPTLIAASPMFLGGLHPLMVTTLYLTNILKPNIKYAGIIGSMGWGGNFGRILTESLKSLKCEFFDQVQTKGMPDDQTLNELRNLAKKVAQNHRELGLL